MKEMLRQSLQQALRALADNSELPGELAAFEPQLEKSRQKKHGDFSSNVALVLVKQTGCRPLELAERITRAFTDLPGVPGVERVEVAPPGFINFFLAPHAQLNTILEVLRSKQHYGDATLGNGQSILLEFVSANPTGPLHVGHGRGAAYGAVLANLLRKAGYRVDCEYYVNDTGRQMDILAVSTWLRYLELLDTACDFPTRAYQGEYVIDIAKALHGQHGGAFSLSGEAMPPTDEDAEIHLDKMIDFAKKQLGDERYQMILDAALTRTLATIKSDLSYLGIEYQNWFSERSLLRGGALQTCLQQLTDNGHCYTQNETIWFRSTAFGDEKDRVLIRSNGQATYFAADIAYHISKFERGYDRLINIWGADHHGYVQRLNAAMQAMDKPVRALDILLVQFASLYRGREKIQMSTRSGNYITLANLYEEIGVSATRIFYSVRKAERHLDFDLKLAKSRSNENPVYYIQYAHARICSVFRKLKETQLRHELAKQIDDLLPLTEPEEQKLSSRLAEYPEVILSAAQQYEPHQLVYYLRDLANDFHTYYNSHQFRVEESPLRNARLSLILACKILLANGLAMLGSEAPEEM